MVMILLRDAAAKRVEAKRSDLQPGHERYLRSSRDSDQATQSGVVQDVAAGSPG